MRRVAIVGAGISGLALAYRLQSLCPADIDVFDAAPRVGGTIWSDRVDGFVVEHGANGFLDNQASTVELSHEIGLGDRLTPATSAARRHRYLALNGRLVPLPTGLAAFARSPIMTWRGKLRLLAEPLIRRGRSRPESVAAFACRRFGPEAAATLFDAITTGIHGGDPALLDVRAAFPRLARLEAVSGSVVRGLLSGRGGPRHMWSFPNGMRELVERLAEKLRRPPRLSVAVRRLERASAGWRLVCHADEPYTADAVVLTCPAYSQADMLQAVDGELARDIGSIRYNRLVVVGLGYRMADVPDRPPGFGFIAPQSKRGDVLGVQWCSEIYPGRAPDGMVLWRALCGGWHRSDIADWPDDRLINAVRAELVRLQGVVAAPAFVRIVRWPRAIPQYGVGHPELAGRIFQRTRNHPGLFLGGNAYAGVAVNDCTANAAALARRVAGFLTAAYDGAHHA